MLGAIVQRRLKRRNTTHKSSLNDEDDRHRSTNKDHLITYDKVPVLERCSEYYSGHRSLHCIKACRMLQ